MPLTEQDVFERIWKFVDQFQPRDEVTRTALDIALDDLVVGINAAIAKSTEALDEVNSFEVPPPALTEEQITEIANCAVEAYVESLTNASEKIDAALDTASEMIDKAECLKKFVEDALEDAKIAAEKAATAQIGAEAARGAAEAARDAAILGAEGVWPSTVSGLAATADGERFIVADQDGWSLYENNENVENQVSGVFPSLSALNDALTENIEKQSVSPGRPGDLLERFTADRSGPPEDGLPPNGAVVRGADPYGQVLDVGPSNIVATRTRYWLDPSKDLVVRAVARVQSNTCDPEGETLTFGVEWLDADQNSIGREILHDKVLWQSDDWQNFERIIVGQDDERLFRWGVNLPFDPNADDPKWALDGSIYECPPEPEPGAEPEPDPGPYPTPFIAAPAGASYAVPFIQTNGDDGVTRIAVLDGEAAAGNITADRITYPLGFSFPKEVMPGEQIKRTIFVAQHGDNANHGRSLSQAVRDIEAARDLAAQDDCVKYSIQVWPGDYVTQGHIDMPDNVSEIVGMSGQRSARIMPAAGFETRNVFRLGDGGMLRNLSGMGWGVDDFDNPSEGFLAVFRPGATIYRAVYIDHCVMYRGQEPVTIPRPLDPENGNPNVPKGPGIAMADGAAVNPNSPFPQMMIEASTTSAPNGVGYCVKNNAFINSINSISIWPHKHFMALNGGEMLMNNCACQFGDYSLWSEGSMPRLIVGDTAGPLVVDTAGAAALDAARTAIVDQMWSATVAAGYSAVNEAFSRRDADNLVTALQYDLISGGQESVGFFLMGLFPAGVFVAPASLKPAFIAGYNGMKSAISNLSMSANGKAMALALIDLASSTVSNPEIGVKPSLISAAGHQWNMPFGGVNRRAFTRPKRQVPDTIVNKDLGTVVYSGLDDLGKQYFTGGALVNPINGQLEGPPIDRTINPRATRMALIAGGMD